MKHLNNKDTQKLQQKGLLLENEIAILEGETVVAENILTKERRIINTVGILLEGTKKLLLD